MKVAIRKAASQLWIPALPVWICSLVLLGLLIAYRPGHTALVATAAIMAVGLAFLVGLLLSAALPRYRFLNERAQRLEAIYEIILLKRMGL